MPKTTTETVEDLQRQADRAAADHAAARAKLEQLTQAARQRRDAALAEYDRRRLAEYDANALEVEHKAAYDRLREALAGDPAFAAFVEYLAAGMRRQRRWMEAQGDASRVGAPDPGPNPGAFGSADWGMLGPLIERLANDRIASEEDARYGAREAAGDAAARAA